jgi:hypothetical protein
MPSTNDIDLLEAHLSEAYKILARIKKGSPKKREKVGADIKAKVLARFNKNILKKVKS